MGENSMRMIQRTRPDQYQEAIALDPQLNESDDEPVGAPLLDEVNPDIQEFKQIQEAEPGGRLLWNMY